jgi:hypothetical protein
MCFDRFIFCPLSVEDGFTNLESRVLVGAQLGSFISSFKRQVARLVHIDSIGTARRGGDTAGAVSK